MNHENDERLVAWLADGPEHGPTANLERAFSVTRRTRPRPSWLVAARGGTIAAEPTRLRLPHVNRFASLALAATAIVVTLLISIGLFVRSPSIGPPPVPDATPTASETAAGAWTATSRMLDDHFAHTATLLSDGTVLVTGGGGDVSTDVAELYDPDTGSWATTGAMIAGRQLFTATLLQDGRVLVAGGVGEPDEVALATAELYDPSTGVWTATGSLTEARFGHTATLLPDGRVLVAGGTDGTDRATAAELYDPRTGAWTATGNMVRERSFHTATLLPDGRVLVAGSSGEFANSAELYDQRSGTWMATAPMSVGHLNFTATLLPNGMVLATGGEGTAELYDPEADAWTATEPMIEVRHTHTATLLPDGTVLVTGGDGGMTEAGEGIRLASTELYDPASGTWTEAANMSVTRRWHTATLLPDSTVLVAGGAEEDAFSSAEVYHPDAGS